jgi:hypothetical protein
MTKRHAKPTAAALSERTYRHVLEFKRTLLNQMAHIRLDLAAARREDREHMKTPKMLMFPGATEEDRARAIEIERKAREKFNDRR